MKGYAAIVTLFLLGSLLAAGLLALFLLRSGRTSFSSQAATSSKAVILQGILQATGESRCKNTLILCYTLLSDEDKKIIFVTPDGDKVKKRDINKLLGVRVQLKGHRLMYGQGKGAKEYLLTTRIWNLSTTTAKSAEFASATVTTYPDPWSVYNNLHVNYVFGRLAEKGGSQANVDLVKRFGLRKYIPQTTDFPVNTALLQRLKAADPDNAPEYAVCFNEPNTMPWHIGRTIPETTDSLNKCIDGFTAVWPNVKIIVNLGSQVDMDPTWKIIDFFPNWPKNVWPAFETRMDDIYGFGLHLYPNDLGCKTQYDGTPGYPWNGPPSDWHNNPESTIECTKRYIYAAKKLLQSKGVDKPIVFTEYGISSVNLDDRMAAFRQASTWKKLWQVFQNNIIEFVSLYSTAWVPDGTVVFDPKKSCPTQTDFQEGSLAYPCRNLELTPYGIGYSTLPSAPIN